MPRHDQKTASERQRRSISIESAERLEIIGTGLQTTVEDFAAAVGAGLTADPKRLDCAWLYDEQGSELFEAICELPEYYATRAERQILETHVREILDCAPPDLTLVELGSGSSTKTRVLIDELLRQRGELQYVPIDISPTILEASSRELLEGHPGLEIHGLAMEYHDGLHQMRELFPGPKLVLWLGSTVGNLARPEAAVFLRAVRGDLDPSDRFLMGIDLRTDARVLEAAYDDAQGVTARFNLNVLDRINRELGGHFDLDAFAHRAVYNQELGRIEMHLVSQREQSVAIDHLEMEIDFEEGETIHTESSHKYSLREIDELVTAAGFTSNGQWLDDGERYSLNRLVPS